MPSVRLYFSDNSKVDLHRIDNTSTNISLVDTTSFTRIFSSEGIFSVKDNKLMREQIKDQSIEKITIQNIEFLMDKSTIKYDVDWYQINPYHIAETIYMYTYELTTLALPTHTLPTHTLPTHTLPTHTLPTHTLPDKRVQLILEKQGKESSSIYFLINENDMLNENNMLNDEITNIIVTFLSGLNLC